MPAERIEEPVLKLTCDACTDESEVSKASELAEAGWAAFKNGGDESIFCPNHDPGERIDLDEVQGE